MKFNEFPKAVIKENVDYTVKEITNVIKRYGPRESGNENCYATQKHIKKEMDTFCDETGFESYKMAPKAFLHFTKTVAISIMAAVFICLLLVYLNVFSRIGGNDFFLAHCIVGGFVCCGLLITMFEFLFYKREAFPVTRSAALYTVIDLIAIMFRKQEKALFDIILQE